MADVNTVREHWYGVADHYRWVPPGLEPMRDLVAELALSETAARAWPITSHFDLGVTSADHPYYNHWDYRIPAVSVQYLPQVRKFQIRFWRFQGIPYDQKWCDLPEAVVTLRWAFRHLDPEPRGASRRTKRRTRRESHPASR